MSPLPQQMQSLEYGAATPAVRPFSLKDPMKVVTDSVQRKLERKRANARLRQQRCRARKRARAQEEQEGVKTASVTKKPRPMEVRLHLMTKKEEQGAKVQLNPVPVQPTTGKFNSWVPPSNQKQEPTSGSDAVAPPSKRPGVPNGGSAWKHPTSTSMYSHPSYYQHHPHNAAYGHWYGTWSHAASAAYYGHYVPGHGYAYHSQVYHQNQVKTAAPTASTEQKLPPTSPFNFVSPKSDDKTGSTTRTVSGATTPYHEVEAMVKSPMRSAGTVQTPMGDDIQLGLYSPQDEFLPPLWSTVTKPTPSYTDSRSPWLAALPSPSMMTTTPAAKDGLINKKKDKLSTLPLPTPIRMSAEMGTWQDPSPKNQVTDQQA